MYNLPISSGIPSSQIRPTETENQIFYGEIGNRKRKIIHYKTTEKLQVENINGLIQVSASARVGLEAFRSMDQSYKLHFIEREAEARVTGNVRLSLNLRGQPDRLHNPNPFPAIEGGEDKIVLSLQSPKRPYYGTVEWNISCYIIKLPKDAPSLFFSIDGSGNESVEKQVKALEATAEIVDRVVVKQIFYIEITKSLLLKGMRP